jgi:hypothetical protein
MDYIMSLVLQSSGGGQITIQEPATASNFTQTLPAASGEVMVSGNQPAFSAWRSTTQSISASTWTKVQCQSEEFDTNSNYDNATNYRFQPTVAGYYQCSADVQFSFTGVSSITAVSIYKNGTDQKGTQHWLAANSGHCVNTSVLIYLNGSTDYIELYGYCAGTSPNINNLQNLSFFQAALVRAA